MIDSFLYYNETDIFFLRTEYLNPYVDRFVIVETDTTFSVQPHAAQFDRVYSQLPQEIKDKIVYHYLEIDKSQFLEGEEHYKDNSRYVEREMRNCLARIIKSLDVDDYMMMSDLDEIPDARRLEDAKRLVDQYGKTFFAHDFRTAYIDWQMAYGRWPGTKMCKTTNMPEPIQELYMSKKKTWGSYGPSLVEAGWHLTMMGDAAMKQAHIDSLREGPGWVGKLNKSSQQIAESMTQGQYNSVVKKGAMRAEKVGVRDMDPAFVKIAKRFPVLWSGDLLPNQRQ